MTNDQLLLAVLSLAGVIVGGVLASIPIWIQGDKEHKRWLIEKRINNLKDDISEIMREKEKTVKLLREIFYTGKLSQDDNGEVTSTVPMEVFRAIQKHLPEGRTNISELSKKKKDEIFIEVATTFERKKIQLQKNIKELLS